MNKQNLIEQAVKEIVKANNKLLRAFVRGEKTAVERIELNRLTMRKYLELA